MRGSALTLGFGNAGVSEVLADADGLGQFGRLDLGGAREQRMFVVAESDGQDFAAGFAGGWPSEAGVHEHEISVFHLTDFPQYEPDHFTYCANSTSCDTIKP